MEERGAYLRGFTAFTKISLAALIEHLVPWVIVLWFYMIT